ncbi:MAG: sodium-translocating pyrophosphatase, partial [Euryarchaeota archaeon]|nr:sodium-translocating pyrophosphatase [Euryarchaeota archaeon]
MEVPMIAAGVAVFGLIVALVLYKNINKQKIENETVADISQQIQDGAMAFLKAEYKYISIFVVIVGGLLFVNNGMETAIAFIAGAVASVVAGFSGMRAATSANGRTAMAASEGGQPAALMVSYNGGAVMGLSVGGLGLLGISLMAMWLGTGSDTETGTAIQNVAGFGMGASSIALFARVGGGIYTKAADVGADLVGKVEAGIPEDDPRNPGVIADNVGDNVGDVAGMGADIFESFVGSIIAAMVIADASATMDADYVLLPIFLGLVGYAASLVGVASMYLLKGGDAAAALRNTTFIGAILFWIGGWVGIGYLDLATGTDPMIAVIIGSIVGI